MTARHHHYLSQFYLRGFTAGRGKKSKLVVFDAREDKRFETTPRNVGGLRDFNRIDTDGFEPDVLEKDLAKFEADVARALRRIDDGAEFKGADRELILHFAAMLAARSPERREHVRQFHEELMIKMMDMTMASEERWESQVRMVREAGADISGELKYAEMKEFQDSRAYKIELLREYQIGMEFKMVEAILPCLHQRNWLVVRSSSDEAPFISCDNPVSLVWKEPEKIPALYRTSPGFAMRDTQVCFPLSKRTALIGEFAEKDGEVPADETLVAALNSKTMHFAYNQVYAPKLNFKFMGSGRELLEGRRLLSMLRSFGE